MCAASVFSACVACWSNVPDCVWYIWETGSPKKHCRFMQFYWAQICFQTACRYCKHNKCLSIVNVAVWGPVEPEHTGPKDWAWMVKELSLWLPTWVNNKKTGHRSSEKQICFWHCVREAPKYCAPCCFRPSPTWVSPARRWSWSACRWRSGWWSWNPTRRWRPRWPCCVQSSTSCWTPPTPPSQPPTATRAWPPTPAMPTPSARQPPSLASWKSGERGLLCGEGSVGVAGWVLTQWCVWVE